MAKTKNQKPSVIITFKEYDAMSTEEQVAISLKIAKGFIALRENA